MTREILWAKITKNLKIFKGGKCLWTINRLLDIGRVVAARAGQHRVFAALGEHLKLVAQAAADRAGHGLDGPKGQAAAREDALIGLVHDPVGLLGILFVGVEGIAVLHDELAPAHQAEARPDLVAELGLDLEKVERQLPVGADVLPDQVGDRLFMGRTDAEVAVVPVLEAQQLLPVVIPAPGLFPELGRHDDGQQDLLGAVALHLFANDLLDLLQDPQGQGQEGIDARGGLADHARAEHQLVADDLGVGRGLAEGGD